MDFDSILARTGLKRETLIKEERETLERWAKQMSTQSVGISEVREHINRMIMALEVELTGYDTPANFTAWLFRKKRLTHVRARLFNYIMLRDFMTAPDRAKEFVQKHIEQTVIKK